MQFLYLEHQKAGQLQAALEHETSKRAADRTGRIRTQQKLREAVKAEIHTQGGQLMKYIGHVQTPFPDRRGTPRQPLLVPAAHGRIQFDRKLIQKDHFQELAQFSHIFVLFVFHENTNTDSASAGSSSKTSVAKIAPPRLGGKKVGCLSTRSPHRPNPIGLSVCEVVGVGDDYIDIRSVDFVDGTPVLDVKPYIPYDLVPTPPDHQLPMARRADGTPLQHTVLRVPEWINEADVPMREVVFSAPAMQGIEMLTSRGSDSSSSSSSKMRFCRSAAHAVELITQVLRQDVRGVKQGRTHAAAPNVHDMSKSHGWSTAKHDQGQEQGQTQGQVFLVRLDGMAIEVTFGADKVVVDTVTPVPRSTAETPHGTPATHTELELEPCAVLENTM